MKNVLKKLSPVSYLACVSFVFSLIGLIFILVSSSGAYPIDNSGLVIFLSILAMVFSLGVIVVEIQSFRQKQLVIDILTWLAVVCLSISLAISIYGRAELMGFVWFSNLMSGNAVARSAMNSALVGWIFSLLSIISLIGSSGFSARVEEPVAQAK